MTKETAANMKNAVDMVKLAMFPVLLAFVIWFMNDFNKRFKQVESDLQIIKMDQRLIQRDVQELRVDTNELKDRMK